MPAAADAQPRRYPFGEADRLAPHPLYALLREDEPLCRVRLPDGSDAWLVTRYDDVRKVLSDLRFSRTTAIAPDEPGTRADGQGMGALDVAPPIRALVAKALSTQRSERLRPGAQLTADNLVNGMLDRGGPIDLVEEYARPLPVAIICEMFGLPLEDRPRFGVWAEVLTSTECLGPQRIAEYHNLLWAYLGELVARRRHNPADDLLSALTTACAGDGLREQEIAQICASQLVAAYDATASQIANFICVVLTHPEQHHLLSARPDLIGSAVEELLRFTPLVTAITAARYATKEVTLSGGVVRAGEHVLASATAANRDARTFHDPDRLDLTRQYNPHLALGFGPHQCIGADTARMMLQVALGTLVRRVAGLRLDVPESELSWTTKTVVRGPRSLPVTW